MPSQTLASHNPSRASREIRNPQKFLAQVDRAGIRPHLQVTLKRYYEVCGSPIGENPAFWKGLRKAAREIGISYRTLKRHHREFKRLGLIELAGGPNSDRRSKKWRLNLDRLFQQDWPDGICPRCRHKHTGDECGCELSPRHWPKKGWVERRCRCVPRPSERSERIGPQRVESPSPALPPASPKPAQVAAELSQPTPPAAPVRENPTLVDLVVDGYDGSRKAERVRKLRAEFGMRVAELRAGCKGAVQLRDGGMIWVEPGHRDYRAPLPRDQALLQARKDLKLSEAQARELWEFADMNQEPEESP